MVTCGLFQMAQIYISVTSSRGVSIQELGHEIVMKLLCTSAAYEDFERQNPQ